MVKLNDHAEFSDYLQVLQSFMLFNKSYVFTYPQLLYGYGPF